MRDLSSIYFIAIGGTGVAPLACLLKAEGYQVAGSDGPLYPPMSTLLHDQGIRPLIGFDPAHLHPLPDLVVVGNAVPRHNPEAVEAERLGLERLSMPEALSRFFLGGRKPLVVAGTHGKTTTSSLAAWVWHACGRDPGYLIGGMPLDLPASFSRGSGERFVVEGDEYNAAYFDRGPKFLHYRPETLILTGVEHDHVDLYPDPESFRAAFRDLVSIMPPDGLIAADGDTQEVRDVLDQAPCRVTTYGLGEGVEVRPVAPPTIDSDGTRFTIADPQLGSVELRLRVPGEHNVRNALGVWIAARRDGLPADEVARALAGFRGAKRRLELVRGDAPDVGGDAADVGGDAADVGRDAADVGEDAADVGGSRILVFDDFAHHPTEIAASATALRQRYPDRRIVVCFEPRSLTAGRRHLFEAYLEAFAPADVVYLAPVFHADRLGTGERLDLESLSRVLGERGVDAHPSKGADEILQRVVADARPGDVVVAMSSGAFGGLPQRLAEALSQRAPRS